jgi:hypothetical protein
MNRNLKSLIQKLSTHRKKFLSLLGGAGAIVLLVLGGIGKNYFFSPQPTKEELPAPTSEEIFSETSSLAEVSEEEAKPSGLDPAVEAYYQRIIVNIRSGNIHGAVITPPLRSEQERKNDTPYLLCAVANCQWTALRLKCEHNSFFRCSQPDCAFAELENYCFHNYCSQHRCQRCCQLVVIYADNYCEKYCAQCLPQTVADYHSSNF